MVQQGEGEERVEPEAPAAPVAPAPVRAALLADLVKVGVNHAVGATGAHAPPAASRVPNEI
jgi:hypothetical protein